MREGISIEVSGADRARLAAVVADRNSPQKHVWRAQIILATAEGCGTAEVMRRAGVSKPCVWRWQERFMREGVAGLLRDKTRKPGLPPLPPTLVGRVVTLTLTEPPDEATHWTGRTMATATGVSLRSVQRIWAAHRLQPHRVRRFKLSQDPAFAAELRDVVGLSRPARPQPRALGRREVANSGARPHQPGLPIKKGRAGTMTHDYIRHGTTTLFAALNVLDGPVIASRSMSGSERGMRAAVVLMLFLSLGGCAAHNWAPGPGMSAADFEPAKARCSLLARHSGSDFAAFGSESYVAGAAVGHVIGESVRTQQDFNDCMLAGGWRIADQPTAAAPQDPRIARLKEIRAELTTCISAIRAKPIYASLQPHLIDVNTGRYTMAQLTDERIPTPEESRLLSAYVDERASCTDNFVATGSQILPAAAPILAQERSDGQAVLLLLVKRLLTWGAAAQRSQQLQEAAAAKLRTMTLPALGPSASTPSPAPVTAATQVVTSSGPAPVPPATPSAVSVPAAHSASSTPGTKERTVASGERQRIDFFYYVNPDCTPGGYMTIRVITPPAHGELTTDQGVDYPHFPKENQRYQCNLRQSPVSNAYYKSNPGYLGTDSTLIEAASPLGTTITSIYKITVR